ncbi:PaaI family thioesterase [Paracoccus fistulariae]|uniref:PaaI family thioesterase n=1 Tax=Paracoccus fistulariae TaxID=658446 RepID=A0ABY7SNK0_9RHOB|nr:PaaI family thioesterase [Paracoccus fistulariae]MDB6180049.1 PaaI family thioesterase [Paracoccus fistulariae]WCR08138.1 PaaI family thioesterase [Paracoccus fistulariae]
MAKNGSEITSKEHARIAQQFIEAIPHAKALDMQVEDLGEGKAQISMPWAEHLVGDPRTGVIHGGVVSTLMDTCSGAAVMAHPSGPRSTATIDLRIDYMRAAAPRQRIVATAECYHMTRNVAFIRAVAVDEDSENPVATATGAFTVER